MATLVLLGWFRLSGCDRGLSQLLGWFRLCGQCLVSCLGGSGCEARVAWMVQAVWPGSSDRGLS